MRESARYSLEKREILPDIGVNFVMLLPCAVALGILLNTASERHKEVEIEIGLITTAGSMGRVLFLEPERTV